MACHDHTHEFYWESPLVSFRRILEGGRALGDIRPGISGVYFLMVGREIVYIGSARCIWLRLKYHLSYSSPTSFNFVTCDPRHLTKWEGRYITEFWPVRNGHGHGKPTLYPKWWWSRLTCAECEAVFVAEPGTEVHCPACDHSVMIPASEHWPPRGVALLPLVGLLKRVPERPRKTPWWRRRAASGARIMPIPDEALPPENGVNPPPPEHQGV